MDTTLFEIPAVVVILSFIAIVVIRAFASSRMDGIDACIKLTSPREPVRSKG